MFAIVVLCEEAIAAYRFTVGRVFVYDKAMLSKIKFFFREYYSLFIKMMLAWKRFFMPIEQWRDLFTVETLWFVSIVARSCDICTPFLPIIRPFPLSRFFIKRYLMRCVAKEKHKSLIFCFPSELFPFFVKRIVPLLEKPFIFVCMDGKQASVIVKKLLETPKLAHVFCTQNDLHPHPKITGFPIGINFHERMCRPGVRWNNRIISSHEQEKTLLQIKNTPLNHPRYNKIYCSFHKSITHPRRQELYELLKENPLCYFKTLYPRELFWKDVMHYQFMLCPRGLNFEALRMWEALVLGIIPIVENSPLNYFFEDLPVVILQSVDDITENNLMEWKETLLPRFDWDAMKKITNTYWIQKIKQKQKELQESF